MNLLKCQLCDYEAKQLFQHIRTKHRMTSSDYRNKFGNDCVLQIGFNPISRNINKQLSDAVKQTYVDTAYKIDSIDHIMTKLEVHNILKKDDYYLKFIGRTKQRTLLTENPILYKSIYYHTNILDDISKHKKAFNKLPNRLRFIVEFNYDTNKLKCKCGKTYTFQPCCRYCMDQGSKSLGRQHSPESIQKMRITTLQQLSNRVGQLAPRYNPQSIPIIEQYGQEHGFQFKHAENGGEFYIKELGYWVDAYDIEKNVVLEIDEHHHFKNGQLNERDVRRQREIENLLRCEFVRIKYEK